MNSLTELEKEVESLPEEDYRRFRHWFMETDWQRWDSQLTKDIKAGKLDFLAKEALDAKKKQQLEDF
jgi:hypothetical protein